MTLPKSIFCKPSNISWHLDNVSYALSDGKFINNGEYDFNKLRAFKLSPFFNESINGNDSLENMSISSTLPWSKVWLYLSTCRIIPKKSSKPNLLAAIICSRVSIFTLLPSIDHLSSPVNSFIDRTTLASFSNLFISSLFLIK